LGLDAAGSGGDPEQGIAFVMVVGAAAMRLELDASLLNIGEQRLSVRTPSGGVARQVSQCSNFAAESVDAVQQPASARQFGKRLRCGIGPVP